MNIINKYLQNLKILVSMVSIRYSSSNLNYIDYLISYLYEMNNINKQPI